MVKNTDYNAKVIKIENKLPCVPRLVITALLNTKATEIENKILDIDTKTALKTKVAVVKSRITDITNLSQRLSNP